VRIPRKRSLAVAAFGTAAALLATAGVSSAAPGLGITDVPTPNTKVAGFPRPDKLSPELARHIVAQGSMALENPSGANTYYGYDGTDPLIPLPGTTLEAQKTEPDKNTYLVLPFQKGADPAYDYGSHFLFQGHETGAPGYITRVNLDADVDHRVTLLANSDVTGAPLPVFDGSTWDPFAKRLLFTAELGNSGGVWQATTAVPAQVQDISGALGRGGYEGIQNDSLGNLYIVEDVGGATLPDKSKAPNSFLYRFVPVNRADLTAGGKLQVLSLKNAGGTAAFDASVNSADVAALHTYGTSFKASWVTIHDTAVDGSTPFDSNARWRRRRAARRSSVRRTACSVRARTSASSTSPRPVTRTRPAAPTRSSAVGAAYSCTSRRTRRRPAARCRSCTRATRTTPASTTSPS
jgi:hypothetical protein